MSMIESNRGRRRQGTSPLPMPRVDSHLPRISDDPLAQAFAARVPLMPWRDKRAIPGPDIDATWQTLRDAPANGDKRLAYVHVPFCANHCLFCGFYRNKYRRADSSRYVQAVIDELHRDADTSHIGRAPIHAIYLGGGTPTALETPDLVRLIEALRRELPLATDCELTLEGRILHFDDEKIDACLEAGINRLSIGVQSFDTRVRQQQGRRASGTQAERFIADLIGRARATVVIDLMYGLPGQSEAIWRRDLETSLALAPDGLDVYCLAMFPGTPLHKAVTDGKVTPPASLAEQGHLYGTACEMLANAGWRQLSNSHWASNTRERNLYNLLIKSGATTLAYGSGAGGSLGGFSYHIDADLASYLDAIGQARKPLTGMLEADSLQPQRDWVTGSLEVARLDLGELVTRWPDLAKRRPLLDDLASHWETAGLAHLHHGTVRLTTAGRFWSTNLIAGFNLRLEGRKQAAVAPSSPSPTQENDMPLPSDREMRLEALRQRLADDQDGILEALAMQQRLSLLDVVLCLPSTCRTRIDGRHFVTVMQALAEWGELTTIVHTDDVIVEFSGPVPAGRLGHGFYNLQGGQGLSGHLKADRCSDIVFLKRPFMGTETASVQFFNAAGSGMFKVFVGRDASRTLRQDQLERFDALAGRLAHAEAEST